MLTPAERQSLIDQIRQFPSALEAAIQTLTEEQINTRYIPTEWTVREIVHHVADSHMNAFIRTKLVLTEDHPTFKPYDQDVWARLSDVTETPLEHSLMILHGVHARWVNILDNLSDDQWSLAGFHPENGDMSVDDILKYYSWHGINHIEHIQKVLAATT